MPTSWSGRLPTSYTRTLYDAHILYDEPIRYDGLVIYDTSWTGRNKPGDFVFQTWDQSTTSWDSLTFTWDTWGTGIPTTTWTGRIIP